MIKRRTGLIILGAFLVLLSACGKTSSSDYSKTSTDEISNYQNTTDDVITKIKKHPINNGYLTLDIELANDDNTIMKSNLKGAFRNQPFIMEMDTHSCAGEVSGNSREWADEDNIYLAPSGTHWYKAKKESEIVDVNALKTNLAINTNEFINPSAKIRRELKLKDRKNKYILSLVTKSQDKAVLSRFARSLLEMTGQNSEGLGMNKQILKDAHLKNLTMQETINKSNYQVEKLEITFEMVYKEIEIKEKETINKIGKYKNLELPSKVKKAKPLSQDVINKMNSISNTDD